MQRPEYFVVRIYRRANGEPGRIQGLIEVVATGQQVAFADLRELCALLQSPRLTGIHAIQPGQEDV